MAFGNTLGSSWKFILSDSNFSYLLDPCLALSGLSVCVGGGGGVACRLCPRSTARRARLPHLPEFILLGSFSSTLLVVFILDIVYDCCFCSPEGVNIHIS